MLKYDGVWMEIYIVYWFKMELKHVNYNGEGNNINPLWLSVVFLENYENWVLRRF